MNSFVNSLRTTPTARTHNGDVAFAGTGDPVLDLFVLAGRRNADIVPAFEAALNADRPLALRVMLWSRDCRGGAGERATSRKMLSYLEKRCDFRTIRALLGKLVEVGRWDDLLTLTERELLVDVAQFLQLAITSGHRLAAKWTPRHGLIADFLKSQWGMNSKQYRRFLSSNSDTVEQKMSRRRWGDINYSHVPSRAGKIYRKAFGLHDQKRYAAWLEALKSEKKDPKVKVNSAVLFPYEIAALARSSYSDRALANAQWDALPDYLKGKDARILPMVDTSGSMDDWYFYTPRGSSKNAINMKATPMDVAISLGLYASARQSGAFHNVMMTWDTSPRLFVLHGKTISEKVAQMRTPGICGYGSTNVRNAFDAILSHAKRNRVSPEDMPTVLLLLSDMEFDAGAGDYATSLDYAKRAFEANGYNLPSVIYWSINPRPNNSPVRFDKHGTAIISGFSPSLFKSVLVGDKDGMTPRAAMLRTIMDERYDVDGVTK